MTHESETDDHMFDTDTLSDGRLLTRIARRVRNVGADELVRHGGLMAAATVVAGGFNYAYQVAVGRVLGAEAYGVFGALFALFFLLQIVGRGVRFSASRFAAELDGADERAAFYRGFLLRSAALGVVGFGVLVAASPVIADFLGLDSAAPVTVVAAAIGVELVLTGNQGTLQGLQRFAALGGFKTIQAGVKFALGVSLVLAGLGLYGAFAGVVLGSAVVLAASTGYLLWRLGRPAAETPAFDYRRAYRYVLPAAVAGFCLTVPANADVVLVKHFFPTARRRCSTGRWRTPRWSAPAARWCTGSRPSTSSGWRTAPSTSPPRRWFAGTASRCRRSCWRSSC
ncbi:hypothetical protein BRC97_05550 [Halobacteriales archaeon QS_6_71_20]|nr:MAG: hypothetical protein BRC97_05550 [Halobacteriales archaeon QS_6_71_20]